MFNDYKIDHSTGWPKIILDYNATKALLTDLNNFNFAHIDQWLF